jgi:biopolymer transport protein ExbD
VRFQRDNKLETGLKHIHLVSFLNILFLLLLFFVLTSSLTSPLSIGIRLPKAVTSDLLNEDHFVITLTSENILYLNDHVVTQKELTHQLQTVPRRDLTILIKADRRASVGRIVDVWNLCRRLGIERINIATN